MSKKNTILLITIMMVGLMVIGGTYALLNLGMNVTNGNYNASVGCFIIDYVKGQDITGTLFPSLDYTSGLSGSVSLKINSSCDVTGTGDIVLNVDSSTSSILLSQVAPHCEDKNSLKYLREYTTSSSCNASPNGVWVTNGSALKYLLFSRSGNSTLRFLSNGYINNTGDITLNTTGIDVTSTYMHYNLYVWMDGYLIDNSYTDLSFSGTINASVTQNDKNNS